jgi:predicted nucleotidyltransferase
MGTQKHYQANPESPVFEELRGIIQKTVGLAVPIREALEPMAGDVRLALIFGSIAKETDSSSSDIDLLIVADEVRLEDVHKTLMPVEEALARRISTKLYTPAEFAQRRQKEDGFVQRILKGPVIELIGSVSES